MAKEALEQEQKAPGHVTSIIREQKVRLSYKTSRPMPSDPLSPARLCYSTVFPNSTSK